VAAAAFLRRERQAPALLVGHSLGGAAMLAAAPRIPEALAVATIGAPSGTDHLRAKLAARLAAVKAADAADAVNAVDRAGHGTAGGGSSPVGSFGGTEEAALELDLGGARPVRISRQLLEDLAGDHLRGVVPALGKPLLLFHSPLDRVVGIEHAERLFLAARHPKSFVSLGSADHLLSDPRDATQVGAVLAAWAARYLRHPESVLSSSRTASSQKTQPGMEVSTGTGIPASTAVVSGTNVSTGTGIPSGTGIPALPPDEGIGSAPELPAASTGIPAISAVASDGAAGAAAEPRVLTAGEVEVTGTAPSLRQEVRLGAHHLVADEPVADGGADSGPTPYGLLLAALGACSGMTLGLYAARKGLPLTGTRVRLRHSRDHRVDCENCADRGARLERIDRELELFGPLTEEQRARLAEIADRCPVHRTLTGHVEIVTKLV